MQRAQQEYEAQANFVSLVDLETLAKERLPSDVYAYYMGGAEDEKALERNRRIFDQYLLSYRVLRGVTAPKTHTSLGEEKLSAPVLVAPMAYHKLVHPEGEQATRKGCESFGVPLITSLFSSTHIQQLVSSDSMLWMQLYIFKDRTLTRNCIEWSRNIGIKNLVVTVDTPVYGKRDRELKSNFELPDHVTCPHLDELRLRVPKHQKRAPFYASLLDPAISWDDMAWLSEITDQNIYLKGIVDPEDTAIASSLDNIKGLIISNHGGRQLDSAPTSLEHLPQHKEKLQRPMDLIIDGGVRRGSDVFKALALGAKAVLLGRPTLLGLSLGGAEGVQQVLETITAELRMTMQLCGCHTLDEITDDYIRMEK
jgi:4-hydroxymandelate oxidase